LSLTSLVWSSWPLGPGRAPHQPCRRRGLGWCPRDRTRIGSSLSGCDGASRHQVCGSGRSAEITHGATAIPPQTETGVGSGGPRPPRRPQSVKAASPPQCWRPAVAVAAVPGWQVRVGWFPADPPDLDATEARDHGAHRQQGRGPLAGTACLATRSLVGGHLIIQTIRQNPSRSDQIDDSPNVSRPDPSRSDQIDAEHQATDLPLEPGQEAAMSSSTTRARWSLTGAATLRHCLRAQDAHPWRRWPKRSGPGQCPLVGPVGRTPHGRLAPPTGEWSGQAEWCASRD
jgi:hypothetical protein